MPAPRPRPLTVLRRPGGDVQVGLDVDGAFVMPGAAEDAVGVLDALASGSPPDALHRYVRADSGWTSTLVAGLSRRGLLVARRTPNVEVWGDGDLARRVADLLRSEDASLRLRPSPAYDDAAPCGTGDRLVVVCPATAEPDRSWTTALTASGQPYLVVRCEPERGVVGPLVQPGRSACVACTDLSRRDLDPDWPALLAQLCRHVPRPDPVLNTWAAATAASQVRAWAGGLADVGHTIELGEATGGVTLRRWPAHRECACAVGPASGQVA